MVIFILIFSKLVALLNSELFRGQELCLLLCYFLSFSLMAQADLRLGFLESRKNREFTNDASRDSYGMQLSGMSAQPQFKEHLCSAMA